VTRPGRWVDPYAGMTGRRLFVAVPLPDEAITAVTEIVDRVRAQPLPDGAHDVRWVRLDGLHLTLRFLGPTSDAQLGPTIAAVERASAAAGPIVASLGGAGTFPPTGRPRTLWVGVSSGVEAIGALAADVSRELEAAGWPSDARPFRAHLTLARSDGIAVGRLVADRLVAAMGDRRIELVIDRLGLFESVTGGGPARYVPVAERGLVEPDPAAAVYHRSDP
jgi:RNA 2',3'-cyclic 3'-phosphodiesterase